MRNVRRIVARTVLGLVSLGAAATVVGRSVLERRIGGEIDALLADAKPAPSATVGEADLERLPEPVRRWLHYSQIVGTQRPTTVRLRQKGTSSWKGGAGCLTRPSSASPPPHPGSSVRRRSSWPRSSRSSGATSTAAVRPAYRCGCCRWFPVANKSGGGLNQGDLLRYLRELQWFPAAALADYLSWEPLEGDAARATMSHGGITASMTFHFGADGRLLEERAIRYNDARDGNEPWVNRNDADGEFGGLRVPVVGEARWEYDSGPSPYIRWRVTDLEQDRPARY